MKNDIERRIKKKIKQYETIVIARHIGPDPDAICSELALRDAIREKYPTKKVYAIGTGVAKFKKYGMLDNIEANGLKNVLLITLDVPNLYRIDKPENLNYKEIIKIDHHPFEEDFGGLEWIDENSSSTCQMVAKLLLNNNFPLNDKIASNLFIGIVSDSDRFLLSYTSIETFKIATAILERTKLSLGPLYEKLYERPIEEVRFHGFLATNLDVSENGFAHVIITDKIIKEYKVDTSSASNMINDFNFIENVYCWCFVTYDEKNKIYKVNIRSKGPIINEIASKYHGGGHKFASGVRTPNKEDIDNLLIDLDKACREYKDTIIN